MRQAITFINFSAPGDSNVLKMQSGEIPLPKDGEVLIEVKAAGVNRADILQRKGLYPPPSGASPILGLECAGIVSVVGKNVSHLKTGDKVCALLTGGGYASHVVVEEKYVLPIPSNLDFIQAAAVPEALATAWLNLIVLAGLKKDETILIHGGGSGVGTFAIQVAKNCGAKVIVTAGSEDKAKKCLTLGADYAINYKAADFAQSAMDITHNQGVDVILDSIGANYFAQHLQILKTYGRWQLISLMGGSKTEIDLAATLRKNIKLQGSTLRSRPPAHKEALLRELKAHAWPMIETGKIKPVIDTVLPLSDASMAHSLMEASHHFGKIVLTTSS